jgi:hypothetical protein
VQPRATRMVVLAKCADTSRTYGVPHGPTRARVDQAAGFSSLPGSRSAAPSPTTPNTMSVAIAKA